MSDQELDVQERKPKYKNTKGDLEKKRKQALENLRKGREKRLTELKARKEETQYKLEESESESSDSSDDELLTSIMKPKIKTKKVVYTPQVPNNRIDKLEHAVTEIIKLQKEHMKKMKKAGKGKSEKIVILPPSAPTPKANKSGAADSLLNALKGGMWN